MIVLATIGVFVGLFFLFGVAMCRTSAHADRDAHRGVMVSHCGFLAHTSKGPYLTGEINGVKVVCFRNTRAENNPKAPTWRVMKSKPKTEQAPESDYSPF